MTQPSTTNFLSQLGFRLVALRFPEVEYFLQRVNIPGLNLGYAQRFTPFAMDPRSGDLTYNNLSLSFKIDEDLKNYLSIHQWITALGFPQNFQQYRELALRNTIFSNFEEGEITSDLRLTLLNNKHNPIYNLDFISAFPISLGDIQLSSTDSDVQYLTAETSFVYTYYTITPVQNSCS